MSLDSGRPTWLGEGPHRGPQGSWEARSAVEYLSTPPSPPQRLIFPVWFLQAKMGPCSSNGGSGSK